MENAKKAVAKLIAGTLSNVAVVGFGLAIFENKFSSLFAGLVAMAVAVAITWRVEK